MKDKGKDRYENDIGVAMSFTKALSRPTLPPPPESDVVQAFDTLSSVDNLIHTRKQIRKDLRKAEKEEKPKKPRKSLPRPDSSDSDDSKASFFARHFTCEWGTK
jgi:hypothetical protein